MELMQSLIILANNHYTDCLILLKLLLVYSDLIGLIQVCRHVLIATKDEQSFSKQNLAVKKTLETYTWPCKHSIIYTLI